MDDKEYQSMIDSVLNQANVVNKISMANKFIRAAAAFKQLIIISFLVFLTACTAVPERAEYWSSSWPPKTVFEAAYESELDNQAQQSADNYMKWIRRFYEGWTFYPEGWDWLTDRVLMGIEDDSQQQLIIEHMYSMGMRISKEWAKSDAHRVINTRHLLVWGETLKLSAARQQELWLAAKVSADIDALLALQLDPSMIQPSRYYADSSAAADADEFDDFEL